MKNIKLRGFVRGFLFGCLAVCGFEALATGGVAGKPNFIEGGFTYYYDSVDGNTPNNPANVYGHIPKTVERFIPPMGETNVIFLSRQDSVTIPTNYVFHGFGSYAGTVTPGSDETAAGYLSHRKIVDAENGNTVSLKAINETPVDDSYVGGDVQTAYFTHEENGTTQYGALKFYFVGRNDAFYRLPINDTYYVVPGAKLWFRNYDPSVVAPWAPDSAGRWQLVTESNFDKFSLSANIEPGTVFHIRSTDGKRDITVHIVDPNVFRFSRHILYFKGLERRLLSTVLYETDSGYTVDDVKTVLPADEDEVSAEATGDGDWELQAQGFYDVDREVTVTMKNGDVVLLKITSMPAVRDGETGPFVDGNTLEIAGIDDDHIVEFRNLHEGDVNPVSLWITDHVDSGSNKVHLAFNRSSTSLALRSRTGCRRPASGRPSALSARTILMNWTRSSTVRTCRSGTARGIRMSRRTGCG